MCTPKNWLVPPNLRSKGYMYPQSKNGVGMLFYSCEILLYIAWVCLHNVLFQLKLVKSRTSSKSSISVVEFSRSLYLCTHLSESIHSWTKGTQTHPTLPYPPTPTHTLLPYLTLPYPILPHPTLPYPIPTLL